MNDVSIHPRVIGNRTFHDKANTAKPHKGGGKLEKRQRDLGRRRVAHAATLKSLPSNVNQNCFRAPGSMNQHK